MILKYRLEENWNYVFNVVSIKRNCPIIKKVNGEEQVFENFFVAEVDGINEDIEIVEPSIVEAFLMNDDGKTIERLK